MVLWFLSEKTRRRRSRKANNITRRRSTWRPKKKRIMSWNIFGNIISRDIFFGNDFSFIWHFVSRWSSLYDCFSCCWASSTKRGSQIQMLSRTFNMKWTINQKSINNCNPNSGRTRTISLVFSRRKMIHVACDHPFQEHHVTQTVNQSGNQVLHCES